MAGSEMRTVRLEEVGRLNVLLRPSDSSPGVDWYVRVQGEDLRGCAGTKTSAFRAAMAAARRTAERRVA